MHSYVTYWLMLGVKTAVDPRHEYRGPPVGHGPQVKNRWCSAWWKTWIAFEFVVFVGTSISGKFGTKRVFNFLACSIAGKCQLIHERDCIWLYRTFKNMLYVYILHRYLCMNKYIYIYICMCVIYISPSPWRRSYNGPVGQLRRAQLHRD